MKSSKALYKTFGLDDVSSLLFSIKSEHLLRKSQQIGILVNIKRMQMLETVTEKFAQEAISILLNCFLLT